MHNIHNPHDKYFRLAMTDIRVAREFFEQYLPKTIAQTVDLKTLALKTTSFVDESLAACMADILYAVQINQQQGYLYILVEHQTNPDKLMPYRLLRYMLRIMDQHLKQTQAKTLPVVFPLVFYSGDKPYPYSTDLFSLFGDHTELAKQAFLKPFILIDLTQISDESLKKSAWMGTMALLLKHITKPNFIHFFKKLIPSLRHLHQSGAQIYLAASLTYMYEAHIADPEEYAKIMNDEISTSLGEKMTSLAEKLKKDGFEIGLHKGRTEGLHKGRTEGLNKGRTEGLNKGRTEGERRAQQKIARKMLEQKADPNFVAKMTALPLKDIEALLPISIEDTDF